MADYNINKGIGKPAEFHDLKAQYLFIFAGGLLALFILFVIMYLIGVNQYFCIGLGIVLSLVLTKATFYLNKKYGTHGLMKLLALKQHPRYIINRKSVNRIFHELKSFRRKERL